MPFNLGLGELVIILVIVIIIFGVGKLPELGGALGKGISEFRRAQAGLDELTKMPHPEEPQADQEEKT
jgi:sec-independent protein translocase protein TatA